MNILVSACLLGQNCKYSGGNNQRDEVLALCAGHRVIPVCPEQMGGLSTPRPPAERLENRVVTCTGVDVTAQYRKGAEETLRLCRLFSADLAILKARSPACGPTESYDGTFTHTKLPRPGVTAEALKNAGVPVLSEEDGEEIRKFLERGKD